MLIFFKIQLKSIWQVNFSTNLRYLLVGNNRQKWGSGSAGGRGSAGGARMASTLGKGTQHEAAAADDDDGGGGEVDR